MTANSASREPEVYHWVSLFVGLLDTAFHLTDEEQVLTASILTRLLTGLRIEDRPTPDRIPAALALEIDAGFYTSAMASPRRNGVVRPISAARAGDPRVSVEAWSHALTTMLNVAYPDLDPEEGFLATKVFADVLTSLGVPARAAYHTPDEVMRAYHAVDIEP